MAETGFEGGHILEVRGSLDMFLLDQNLLDTTEPLDMLIGCEMFRLTFLLPVLVQVLNYLSKTKVTNNLFSFHTYYEQHNMSKEVT